MVPLNYTIFGIQSLKLEEFYYYIIIIVINIMLIYKILIIRITIRKVLIFFPVFNLLSFSSFSNVL